MGQEALPDPRHMSRCVGQSGQQSWSWSERLPFYVYVASEARLTELSHSLCAVAQPWAVPTFSCGLLQMWPSEPGP